jgi:hypothetical protein
MKNPAKKEIRLKIVIDAKYLKGKRDKKDVRTLVLLCMVLIGHHERLVMSIEDGLLLNHHTG